MKPKLLFFLAGVVIILGLIVYGYLTAIPGSDREGGPKIEITPQSFDFGEKEYGQILEYSFVVKNTGQTVLEINKVATSCSCTTAKVSKELIEPGQTALLEVRYDTGLMTGSHGQGFQERIISVRSNDPASPQTEVLITALVK